MQLPRKEDFRANFLSSEWLFAAEAICRKHDLPFNNLQRCELGESVVYLIDDKFAIKIYIPTKSILEREQNALNLVRTRFQTPEVVASGELENYKYLVTTQIKGEVLNRELWLKLAQKEQIEILTSLARGLKELHRSETTNIAFDWDKFIKRQAETCFERQKACQVNDQILAQMPEYLAEHLQLLPETFQPVFLHGDVHFGNLRLSKDNGVWEISGLFDFGDSLIGFHEYDFLAVGILMIQGQGDLQREFFRAYGYADCDINDELRKRLMLLTMFYEWSDLRRYAIRLRPSAVDYSLIELEQAIWNFC